MNIVLLVIHDVGIFAFKKTKLIEQVVIVLVPGDYSNIAPAYKFLAQWIEENEYTICGSARALPLKGACSEENPNEYLAEIQVPVKKIIN